MVSILCALQVYAKYVSKKAARKGIVTWTCISMAITAVLILFIFTDTRRDRCDHRQWNMIVFSC